MKKTSCFIKSWDLYCRIIGTELINESCVGTAAMYDNMLWCIYVGLTGRMTQLKVLCLIELVQQLCVILCCGVSMSG